MSMNCEAPKGASHQLSHPDPVEKQLILAGQMEEHEIMLWASGEIEPLGTLAVESMISLIKEYHFAGKKTDVVNELITLANQKIQTLVTRKSRRIPPGLSIPEICDDVASLFWTQVFDHGAAPWAEICFWKVVSNLFTDVVRLRKVGLISIDSSTRTSARELADKGLSLEVRLGLREALGTLKPNERRAFWLRYGCGLSVGRTGELLHRDRRSVRNLLHSATSKLQLMC